MSNDTGGMQLPKPQHRRRPPQQVLRSLDQIFGIFDNGEYLPEIIAKNAELHQRMASHRANHNTKTKGSLTLTIHYELGKLGDVSMTSTCEIKAPKSPPSSAVAYATEEGLLTLYSPMLAQMEMRDAFDPETGEIR